MRSPRDRPGPLLLTLVTYGLWESPFWLVDDALGSGVDTRIGNRIEPMPQLGIQIVEVAEGAGKEEVLTNVAVRSLNLALGFGPIRAARLRLKAIVPGNIDEHVIVDNAARIAYDAT